MKSAIFHYFENPHIVHTCSATFEYILSGLTKHFPCLAVLWLVRMKLCLKRSTFVL